MADNLPHADRRQGYTPKNSGGSNTSFIDFYRSTLPDRRSQVNAERKAERAEAKAAQAASEAKKAQEEAKTAVDLSEAKEKVNSFLNNLRSAIENAAKETANSMRQKHIEFPEAPKKIESIYDDANTVEYTYRPGDSFGQVINNLGLNTDAGLWGPNGDVAYYTQQLATQGALNSRGNIPVGTKIKLHKRNTPFVLREPEEEKIVSKEVIQDATYPELQKVTSKTPRRV